ncbi:MAG: hydrolase 1, exosortase A system-associated [Casimicrobiaceae bacterium]
MNYVERALVFPCAGDSLIAVLSVPEGNVTQGVVIVVGGPQYRAGSHRQFVLLARGLAGKGLAAMRFDYRGMGDAQGQPRSFEAVGDDLRAAIDAFFHELPGVQTLTLWGLCDAASAVLMYAHADPRIAKIVLVNPWVRSAATLARTQLKHYYGSRLADREFWNRICRGEFDFSAATRSFVTNLGAALGVPGRAVVPVARAADTDPATAADTDLATAADKDLATVPHADLATATHTESNVLAARMADGLRRFKGRALVILSGRDLTAREFVDVSGGSPAWPDLRRAERIEVRDLPEADHTFSRREWREQVIEWTAAWAGP